MSRRLSVGLARSLLIRIGLVLPVLPRSRARPRPRSEPEGPPPAGGGLGGGSRAPGRIARCPLALRGSRAQHRHPSRARPAVSASRLSATRRRRATCRRTRSPGWQWAPTRSPTSRSATGRPLRASSGRTSATASPAAAAGALRRRQTTVTWRSRWTTADQSPGADLGLVSSFPGLAVGADRLRRYTASSQVRRGHRQGPTWRRTRYAIHARVTRPYSHSSSDNQARYRSAEELADEAAHDPIQLLETELLAWAYSRPPTSSASRARCTHHRQPLTLLSLG